MDKATRQCAQTTTFLKRKESWSGIKLRSLCLPASGLTTRPNWLTIYIHVFPAWVLHSQWECVSHFTPLLTHFIGWNWLSTPFWPWVKSYFHCFVSVCDTIVVYCTDTACLIRSDGTFLWCSFGFCCAFYLKMTGLWVCGSRCFNWYHLIHLWFTRMVQIASASWSLELQPLSLNMYIDVLFCWPSWSDMVNAV